MNVLRLTIAGALVSATLLPLTACNSPESCGGPTSDFPVCRPNGSGGDPYPFPDPIHPGAQVDGGAVGSTGGSGGRAPEDDGAENGGASGGTNGGGAPPQTPDGSLEPGDAGVPGEDAGEPTQDAGTDAGCDQDPDSMCEGAQADAEGTMQAPDGSMLVLDRVSVRWSEAEPSVLRLLAHATDELAQAHWLEVKIVGTEADQPPKAGLYGVGEAAIAPLEATLRACEPGEDSLDEMNVSLRLDAFDPEQGMAGVLFAQGDAGSTTVALEMLAVCEP